MLVIFNCVTLEMEIEILILKCFISVLGSLNLYSTMLNSINKGVFESIYSVKILNTLLFINFITTNGLIYSQHLIDLASLSGEGSPSPVHLRREIPMTLEMKDNKKINWRNS